MALWVVDASVVIEYLIQGPYTDSAREFFAQVAFIAIARRADAPLASLDQSQRRAATAKGVSLAPVVELK